MYGINSCVEDSIFASAGTGSSYFILDWDYSLAYIDPRSEIISQYTVKELIGRTVWEVFPFVEKPANFERFSLALRGRIPQHWEMIDEQAACWLEISVYPSGNAQAGVLFRDITEKVQAKERMLNCEERYRAFMTASFERIFRVNADGSRLELLNAEELCNTGEDFFSNWMNKYIHPGDWALITGEIHKALIGKSVFDAEFRGIRADGSWGWYHSRAVPIVDDRGHVVEWLGIATDITLNKEFELSLLAKEKEYMELLDSSFLGITTFDFQARELIASDSFKKRLGLEHVEAKNMLNEALKRVHPQDIDQFRILKRKISKEKLQKVNLEYRCKTTDAGYTWVLEQLKIVYDGIGNPQKAYCTYIDINDRKLAEEALRISETKFRSLFNSIDEGFAIMELIYDETGQPCDERFIETNQVCEKLFGQTDLNGKLLSDVRDYTKEEWLSPYEQMLRSGEPLRAEEYSHNNGRWYSIYASRVGETGSHQYALIFNDITERKNKELRQAFILKLNQRLRWLSDGESIKDIVTKLLAVYLQVDRVCYNDYNAGFSMINSEIGDPDKIVETYDRSMLPAGIDLLQSGKEIIFPDVEGYAPVPKQIVSHWISKNIRAAITIPIFRDGRLTASLSVQNSGLRRWTPQEVLLVRKTAERSWMAIEREASKQTLQESEKKAKELNRELEKLDEQKNRFISIMSHELRNPLAAITAGIQVIAAAEDAKHTEKAKEIILRQVNQLGKLVDDLLDMQRISKNKIKLNKGEIFLNEIIIDAVKDMQAEFDEKDIKIKVDIPAEPVVLYADPVRIIQCIGNLLRNAWKFSPPYSIVKVFLKIEQDWAVICVQDNGIGLDPQKVSDLFKPFTQAEDLTGGNHNGGLGLGLAIVKDLMRMHGGTITAHSRGLGQGSEFTMRLPVARPKRQADYSKGLVEVSANLKVLVIDDNKDLNEVICSLLEILGHTTSSAYAGREGLTRAWEDRPDMIVCDLGLPDIDGCEVARTIREIDEFKDVYMVALSGYAEKTDIERALENGFDRHLAKPVNKASLQQVINACWRQNKSLTKIKEIS